MCWIWFIIIAVVIVYGYRLWRATNTRNKTLAEAQRDNICTPGTFANELYRVWEACAQQRVTYPGFLMTNFFNRLTMPDSMRLYFPTRGVSWISNHTLNDRIVDLELSVHWDEIVGPVLEGISTEEQPIDGKYFVIRNIHVLNDRDMNEQFAIDPDLHQIFYRAVVYDNKPGTYYSNPTYGKKTYTPWLLWDRRKSIDVIRERAANWYSDNP